MGTVGFRCVAGSVAGSTVTAFRGSWTRDVCRCANINGPARVAVHQANGTETTATTYQTGSLHAVRVSELPNPLSIVTRFE